jgi:hypothetical protein
MLENIKYSVVVLLNNDVWAVWELPGKPESREQLTIRQTIAKSLEEIDSDEVFRVQFTETIPADNVKELIAGLKESIENHIGYG